MPLQCFSRVFYFPVARATVLYNEKTEKTNGFIYFICGRYQIKCVTRWLRDKRELDQGHRCISAGACLSNKQPPWQPAETRFARPWLRGRCLIAHAKLYPSNSERNNLKLKLPKLRPTCRGPSSARTVKCRPRATIRTQDANAESCLTGFGFPRNFSSRVSPYRYFLLLLLFFIGEMHRRGIPRRQSLFFRRCFQRNASAINRGEIARLFILGAYRLILIRIKFDGGSVMHY